MSSYTTLLDGQYARGLYVGRPKIAWPFLVNGDRTSIVITREFRCRESTYQPAQLGIERDPAYADAFMMTESDPQPTGISDLISCTRTFARVPRDQTVPSSIVLTRPSLSGTFPQVYGDFRIFQPDTSLLTFEAYNTATVTGDSGLPSFYPTGGTYTLTFSGYTTGALNYNDNAATVQTALNAMTSVSNRGNVVVTGSYNSAGGFVVTFNAYAQITLDTGSLTGGTISKVESLSSSGYVQSLTASVLGYVSTPMTGNGSALVSISPYAPYNGTGMNTLTYSSEMSINGYTYGIANYTTTRLVQISCNSNGAYTESVEAFTGGTFTMTIEGVTTGAISYNASIAEVQVIFEAAAPARFTASAWTAAGMDSSTILFPTLYPSYKNVIQFLVTVNATAATGGTFTVAVGANTSAAIAYNANAATTQTALNLLTSVSNRGNCVVTGTSLALGFSIAFTNAVMTTSATSLTPAGCAVTPTISDSSIGRTQVLTFTNPTNTRDLTVVAHGYTTQDVLYIKQDTTYHRAITAFSLPDANTIRLSVSSSAAYAGAAAITECGWRTKTSYTPGAATVPARRITSFYLPGYTTGISSADDIEIPANQSDGVNFMLAALSGAGSFNYQVGELIQWQGSPILSLTKTTINAIDI